MNFPKSFLDYLGNLIVSCPTLRGLVPEEDVSDPYREHKKPDDPPLSWYFFSNVKFSHATAFNRVATSLYVKYLLEHPRESSYHLLTRNQFGKNRLTRGAYDELTASFYSIRNDACLSKLLDVYLIIRAYAATKEGRTEASLVSGREISPLFPVASATVLIERGQFPEAKDLETGDLLFLTHAVKADLPLYEAISGEAPASLSHAFEVETDTRIGQFTLLANLCEIAGHAGAVTQHGSKVLTEDVAEDYLTIERHFVHRGIFASFYREEATKLLFGSDYNMDEAIAAVRLSRMMGVPSEARFAAEYLTRSYPTYEKFVREMSLGSPWNPHAEQPIAFVGGRRYLSNCYDLNVRSGCQLPLECTIRTVLPSLIEKIKSVRRASLINPPREELIYLDLSEEAARTARRLDALRSKP